MGWGSWVALLGCQKLRLYSNYCFHCLRKDSYYPPIHRSVTRSSTARALLAAALSLTVNLSPNTAVCSPTTPAVLSSSWLPPLQASFTRTRRMRTHSFTDLCVHQGRLSLLAFSTAHTLQELSSASGGSKRREKEIRRGILC